MGNPEAAIMVNNFNQMRKEFQYNESDRLMFIIHAIRYLFCASERDGKKSFSRNEITPKRY